MPPATSGTCCWVELEPTFLCALRNCAVQAIFAGRLRWWNIDLHFRFMNKYVCGQGNNVAWAPAADVGRF